MTCSSGSSRSRVVGGAAAVRGDFGGICQSRQSGHRSGGIHRNLCQLPASWQQGTVTQTPAVKHFRVERTTVSVYSLTGACQVFVCVHFFMSPSSLISPQICVEMADSAGVTQVLSKYNTSSVGSSKKQIATW